MLSRLVMRAAPLVVALAVIALLPTVALLGRLGLLTDPMVLALGSMALAMAAIAVAAWPLGGPELLAGPSWGPELDPPPPLALLGLSLFGVAEVGSLTAMAIRLRRAKGNEREQIKR